jgi:putative Ca2+/H+ antiporter (TMEM165/GDT1 family)
MDWKTFLSSFGLLFLAEMGDKTQLAVINMTCSTNKYWAVFLGASAAMVAVTGLGVFFGDVLVKLIPQNIIHAASGILFIAIGALILSGKF